MAKNLLPVFTIAQQRPIANYFKTRKYAYLLYYQFNTKIPNPCFKPSAIKGQ